MKVKLLTTLAAGLLLNLPTLGQTSIPTGSLDLIPNRVTEGTKPRMGWSIQYPEVSTDIVDITDNNQLLTNRRVRIQVRVVGVAFQSGSTHLPVALWTSVGGSNWQQVFSGRYNDVDPETPVFDEVVDANTIVNFSARGQGGSGSWYDARSTTRSDVAITALVDGDPVPSYAPAYQQGRIESFLSHYITGENLVTLGSQDIIYLFELATRNTSASYFDMQDLVTVVTFTEESGPGASTAGSSTADEYINYIRQIQNDSGTELDVTVGSNGSQYATAGVPLAGSRFQLWTVNQSTGTEYLLDEAYVSAYFAQSAINITTADPYKPVHRTRVDQPFEVSIEVSGLKARKDPRLESKLKKAIDGDDDDDGGAESGSASKTKCYPDHKGGTDQGKERDDDDGGSKKDDDDDDGGKKKDDDDDDGGKPKGNNGHGNNEDGVDVSNPGKGKGGPNGRMDPSGDYDDEKKGETSIFGGGTKNAKDSKSSGNGKKKDGDDDDGDDDDGDDDDGDDDDGDDDDGDDDDGKGEKTSKKKKEKRSPDKDRNLGNNIGNCVAPVDATKVILFHNAYPFEGGVPIADLEDEPTKQAVGNLEIKDNGATVLKFVRTNLDAPDLTGAEGEEVFTIAALAGQDVSETILESKRVQIFPIAQATISGIDSNTEYQDVPPITVALNDLYPSSTTYVRIYPGQPVSNPSDEKKVRDSVVVINDATTHDRDMVLKNLDEYFLKHGAHTIEVVHKTPFGTDLLAQQAILVDRNIVIKASVYSEN